jgi:hypothetical protein
MPQFKLDEPKICWVGWQSELGYESIHVGQNGVTAITHRELFCGENSVHWLEIWHGSRIIARFNVANVDSIHYEEA